MLADIISIEKVELKNNQTFVIKSEHFKLNFPINQKISHFSVLYVHYYQNSVQIVLAICSCRNWGGGGGGGLKFNAKILHCTAVPVVDTSGICLVGGLCSD